MNPKDKHLSMKKLPVWRSPLLAFTDEKTNANNVLQEGENVITTPDAGWYAICFSMAANEENDGLEHNQNNFDEDGDNDEERNQRRAAKAGYQQEQRPKQLTPASTSSGVPASDFDFSLSVHGQTEQDENLQTVQKDTKIRLDVIEDKTTKELALDIGRLYYLPENTPVTVAVASRNDKNEADEQSITEPINQTKMRWFLLLRRSVSVEVRDAKIPKQPGTVLDCKKSIMCASCQKRFASSTAALDHWSKMHQKKDVVEVEAKGLYNNCPQNLPDNLHAVFQDNHMAVIDKPQGVAVMGDKNTLCRSDLLLSFAVKPEEASNDATDNNTLKYLTKPMPVHRLDAGTGGLLVIAKTAEAVRHLKGSFANRDTQKRYRALLLGRLEPSEGIIDQPVGGQPSKTRYNVLDYHPCYYSTDGWLTAVDLFPETGRRHQLRKHMKHMGHSIIGDRRYAGCVDLRQYEKGRKLNGVPAKDSEESMKDTSAMSRLCLWAVELTIPHPWSNKAMMFSLPDPEWYDYVISHSAPGIE